MRWLELGTALQFAALSGIAWLFAGGLLWFGLGLLLSMPQIAGVLFVLSGCAGAFGLYAALLTGFLAATGRGGVPADYLYDLTLFDVLGSSTLTLAFSIAAGALGALHTWQTGAFVAAIVFALFAATTGRGFLRGLRLRRALPPSLHFWPSDPLREHRPTGPLEDPVHLESGVGEIWGWTQPTARGSVGVIYVGNPTLAFGSPAPNGRVQVVAAGVRLEDLEAMAAGLG